MSNNNLEPKPRLAQECGKGLKRLLSSKLPDDKPDQPSPTYFALKKNYSKALR